MAPEVAGLLTAIVTVAGGIIGGRYALLAKRVTAAVQAQATEVEAGKQEVAADLAVLDGVQVIIEQLRAQNLDLAVQLKVAKDVTAEATSQCDQCRTALRSLRTENADLIAAVKVLASDLRLADDWSLTDYARARWGGSATPEELHRLIDEAKHPRRRAGDPPYEAPPD